MKRLLALITVLLFICSVASASSYPVSAKPTRNGQIVRESSDTKSKKIDSVGTHDSVTVIGEEINKSGILWYKVKLSNGKIGYIAESGLDLGNGSTPKEKQTAKSDKTAKNEKNMKVIIKATCNNYNHVGKNWQYEYKINNEIIQTNSKIKVNVGQTLKISTKIVEYDKYPDIGTNQITHTITEEDLKKGFKIEHTINVTEGHGRYAGNTCTWKIVYTFK